MGARINYDGKGDSPPLLAFDSSRRERFCGTSRVALHRIKGMLRLPCGNLPLLFEDRHGAIDAIRCRCECG